MEAADPIEADYIVEVDYIADIVEKKGIAGNTHLIQIVDIAGEKMDIVVLVLPVGVDS